MTRGFLYMFRLEPLNAARANPASPVVFALAASSVADSARRLLRARTAAEPLSR
jgi:hypothetical protein